MVDEELEALVSETVAKFDDEFFAELEKAGGCAWPGNSREQLKRSVEYLLRRRLESEPPEVAARSDPLKTIRILAARLLAALSDCDKKDQEEVAAILLYDDCERYFYPDRIDWWDDELIDELKARLSELARPNFQRTKRSGKPFVHFISVVALIFKEIGGGRGISPEGPLARVLRTIHERLPEDFGPPKTPDAMVKLAERSRPEIKKYIYEAEIPL